MIRLCTLERLTGIDDQRTGKRHLRQSEEGTEGKTMAHQQRKFHIAAQNRIQIIQQGQQAYDSQYGDDADHITTVMLNEKGHEESEEEQAYAKGSHDRTDLMERQTHRMISPVPASAIGASQERAYRPTS